MSGGKVCSKNMHWQVSLPVGLHAYELLRGGRPRPQIWCFVSAVAVSGEVLGVMAVVGRWGIGMDFLLRPQPMLRTNYMTRC